MNYRREIDGLRALAVMPVILYHAGSSLFSGGFIGVDIFFVISGYLITGLMMQELDAGTFSLRRFYIRRARRILPALFTVSLVTIPLAYLWLLPVQHQEYSKSLLAVLLFASNILFWRETGYFSPEASEKPLLHTWSLGVEEQFYMVMPLLMLVLWRTMRHRINIALLIIAAISFAACELASRYAPAANFFLLPTRMWELALGGFAAWGLQRHEPHSSNGFSLFGLGLILLALTTYDDSMRLPSALTLVPVLGSLLVLRYGTQGTYTARLLGSRALVAVGLVSYSAYLWHHPLLAFARVAGISMQSAWILVTVLVLTFALAWLSWRYIEQPFRDTKNTAYVKDRAACRFAAFAALFITVIGLYGYASHGRENAWKYVARPEQVRANELIQAARAEPRYFDSGDCVFNVSSMKQAEQERLTKCAAKHGRGIAVFGDSHAINLFYLMKESAPDEKFLVGISQGMCRPHSDNSTCYYHDLSQYLLQHSNPFHTMLYTQAGFYLMQNRHGKPLERNDMVAASMDEPWPEFIPNDAFIAAVKQYLIGLVGKGSTRMIWVGAHASPHFREPVIVRMGCDANFHLRPNQIKPYEQLDHAIQTQLVGSPIEFRSQLGLLKFDMTRDFMNCDVTYFMDGDHYSAAGEARFAKRETLRALISEKP